MQNENYTSSDRFYSPLVRKIAQEEKISRVELDSILGSGRDGRVQKQDILNFIANKNTFFNTCSVENTAKPITAEKISDR